MWAGFSIYWVFSKCMKLELLTEDEWRSIEEHQPFAMIVCPTFGKHNHLYDRGWLNDLTHELFKVAASAFSVPESPAFYQDVKNHIMEADMLAVCATQEKVLGFAAVKNLFKIDTFFIHGIAIHADAHKMGVASRLIDRLLINSQCRRVAFTTQNPRMYCLLREKVGRCFPSPAEPLVPQSEHDYGAKLVQGRAGNFDPETFVNKDLYSQCLYPSIPNSGDMEVNNWFHSALEIEDGKTRHGILLCGERGL